MVSAAGVGKGTVPAVDRIITVVVAAADCAGVDFQVESVPIDKADAAACPPPPPNVLFHPEPLVYPTPPPTICLAGIKE